MKSETINLHGIYQDRRQYRVPFYQRHYVWTEDEQWAPLWSDVLEKADARRASPGGPAPHFLGAIVLEPQPREGLKGVESFHVIDGQQRLTTLQYLLAALAMTVRERDIKDLVPILDSCIWNPNPEMMNNPGIEVFKLWPTFRDRSTFEAAMKADSRDTLRVRFPTSFTQSGTLRKVGVEHPPALEAIWYFRHQIEEWLAKVEQPAQALEKLTEAILKDLKVVTIVLEEQDDAQIIFETLNGRGAQLHASDLIRNYIFMRADQQGADSEHLYETLWRQFEDTFWSQDQRRGRLKRPRLEWFVQSTVQAETGEEVDIGRLYEGYRNFAQSTKSAQGQLEALSGYADNYRNFILASRDTPIGWFGAHVGVWDASPVHSIALAVAASDLPDDEQREIYTDLLSYVVRRAICGLSNKGYNKIFLQLLKRNRKSELTPDRIRAALASLRGEASRWPSDADFMNAWLNARFIPRVGEIGRVRYVLTALESQMRTAKSEEPVLPSLDKLDVDHILPESWIAHWPVAGKLVTKEELRAAIDTELMFGILTPDQQPIMKREAMKHTIGNLTLLHYGVNRSLQDGAFIKKREELFKHSNLHLNRKVMLSDSWDEAAIEARGRELFHIALKLWPGPPS